MLFCSYVKPTKNFYLILIDIWQYGSTGSDNGLVLSRQQAIIWSNIGMLYWHIYASPGFNELSLMNTKQVYFMPAYM